MTARYLILGNSGSGKSTLAARLARGLGGLHLDLDTLAWQPEMPPRRRPVEASVRDVVAFMDAHDAWVIEGCYADLLDAVAPRSTRLVFLDPGVEACIANARRRPWEPHKYESAAAQDANLEMLVAWIRDYEARSDEFSRAAHRALFERFAGDKIALTSCDGIGAFSG